MQKKVIDQTFLQGKLFRTRYFRFYFLKKKLGKITICPVISKKIFPKAITRNYLKRVIRAVAHEKPETITPANIIVVTNQQIQCLEMKSLYNEVKKSWRKFLVWAEK